MPTRVSSCSGSGAVSLRVLHHWLDEGGSRVVDEERGGVLFGGVGVVRGEGRGVRGHGG